MNPLEGLTLSEDLIQRKKQLVYSLFAEKRL